jgi:hypothetical protein
MIFAMNRQSYQTCQQWVLQYDLTYPVVHDPPPSENYYKYSHGYVPQNTLTDRNFTVIYDEIGYNEVALINAIEEYLCPVSVVLEGSSESAIRGEYFSFDATLKNWGDTAQTFQAWLDAILPDHNPAPGNPQRGPITRTLNPGETRSVTLQIFIPETAPLADNYRLKLSIGTYPDDIINCDLIEVDIVDRD